MQHSPDSTRWFYRFQISQKNYSDSILRKYINRKDNLVKTDTNGAILSLTGQHAGLLAKQNMVSTLTHAEDTSTMRFHEYFPYKATLQWNSSHYGPIIIPRKGVTVMLDTANLVFYKKIIEDYEQNKLEVMGSKIYINGLEAAHYTFNMDYYFMMGDNRFSSYDSRFRGFIPEDYIIGKASFIIFSIEKDPWQKGGIRWWRTLNKIK
jgi:signal peptidase I